jgi:hypothetical protein
MEKFFLEMNTVPKAMWAFGITWRPSFVVCHLLTFHILIFSSETHQSNELKVSRKHLWKVLSKEYKVFFRNEPIRNKNCLWRPCLLTDQDEISNLYRGPSIDDSYQVSVHLAKRFRRRKI